MAKQSGSSRNTQTTVPEARAALDNMKYEIARELGINPNTVAKAYQDLEKSGLIYSVAGKGSFISGEETLDRQMTASVLDRFREAVREARSAGVDRQTALALVEEVYKEGVAQ